MRIFILLTCVIGLGFLSGCADFSAPTQSSPGVQPIKKANTNKRPRRGSSQADSSGISLNDFTGLNLNNDQPTSGNLWEEMAHGLQIPNPESHPEVQTQIHWFETHPGYLERTTERARPYLYLVYQEVKNRHLPTELVLLPINESAYYPFSYSSAGATGIWQLMPGTASNFGLRRNLWYDGRRDIFDSTNAALDYLTYLAHYYNNDWLLAIAAYDTGEGNVQRAINRNEREGLPTDFWSLHLASETRSYVPRLLALAAIIAHPERYPSIQLPPIDARPVVAPVKLGHQIKLTDAAKLAGISVNQLKVLNPGLSRTATEPSSDAKLFLPIDSIDTFKSNISGIPAVSMSTSNQPQSFGHYRVQRGDTLQSIANRFGISEDDLRNANSILGRRILPGRILNIPNVAENFKPNTEINLDQTALNLDSGNAPMPQQKIAQAAPIVTNSLADADSGIANSQKTNQADISNKALTPSSAPTTAKTTIATKHVIKHKVTRGETLSSISRRYHVSVLTLISLNPGINKHPLKPGTVIVIQATNDALPVSSEANTDASNTNPAPIPPAKTSKKPSHAHVVKKSSHHSNKNAAHKAKKPNGNNA